MIRALCSLTPFQQSQNAPQAVEASIHIACTLCQGEGDNGVEAYVQSKGLAQISDAASIEAMVDAVLAQCPKELEQYRAGKTKLQGHFVGCEQSPNLSAAHCNRICISAMCSSYSTVGWDQG